MSRNRISTALILLLLASYAQAITIVEDNFDDYADDAALEAVWSPDNGNGNDPLTTTVGLLTPRPVGDPIVLPPPYDGSADNTVTPPVPELTGKAVVFSGQEAAINEYNGPNAFTISPSATESIRLTADIFDFAEGNRRFSVGLRDDLSPSNLLELGHYNSDGIDPTDGVTVVPTTGYAYRVILWGDIGGDLIQNPNWQYFQLPAEFDDPGFDHNGDGRVGNGDGLVDPVDVGPGWHTYSATITDADVTLELDLFRDGTVDASVTWEVTTTAAPFNSLRMGGPSGISSAQPTMVDNILLETIAVGSISGDFDGNGFYECADVDGLVAAIVNVKNGGSPDLAFDLSGDSNVTNADLDLWLAEAGAVLNASGNPILLGDADLDGNVNGSDFLVWNNNKFTATSAWCDGDFDADGNVNGADFLIWNNNKFTSADVSAVPEPASLGCLILACCGFLILRRS